MNRIDKLKQILRTGTAGRMDGTTVDTFTAGILLGKYNRLNTASKAKFANLTIDKMVNAQTKKSGKTKKTASGPTLNETYNDLLVKWEKMDGHPSSPHCEDCAKDMTGKDVVDTGVSWLCTDCAEKDEGDSDNYVEDFEAGQYKKKSKKSAKVKKTAVNWGGDQAKYWASIKSDAEAIAKETEEGSEEEYEIINEYCDNAMTYTADAIGCLLHSNNDDAMFEEGVGDLASAKSASDVYTMLGYWAYRADLQKALARVDRSSKEEDEDEE